MKNFIQLDDGVKVEISKETAQNLREKFGKPKLRHGDWWLSGGINVYMKQLNGPRNDCVALSDCLITNIGSDYHGEPILGNIFDDLAALQEDVGQFEVKSTHGYNAFLEAQVCGDSSSSVNIILPKEHERGTVSRTFELPDLKEISLKLRQLIATMERKQCSKQ